MEKALIVFIGILGVVGFLFATIAFFSVFNAWVLSILWSWFVVPTFHFPELTIPQAIGLGLVVSSLTYSYKKTDNKDTAAVIFGAVVGRLLVLFVGWIVHGWFM